MGALPSPPLYFPSLPFPSPFPSSCPAQPLPPRSDPQIQLGGLGERCKLPPAGSGAEPQPKSNLMYFSLKIRHLVATILIFLRVLREIFLWPHYSGTPGSYATGIYASGGVAVVCPTIVRAKWPSITQHNRLSCGRLQSYAAVDFAARPFAARPRFYRSRRAFLSSLVRQ